MTRVHNIFIIAYPKRITETEEMPVHVVEGSDITLPCNMERPFLNNYTVRWTVNGESKTLSPGQFDLQLTNVPLSNNNRMYMCHVETSIDQPETGADAITTITLMVNVIPQPMYSKSSVITFGPRISVMYKHFYHTIGPATIVSDIVVEVVDSMYQFTVAASGTSPLSYTWYINNTRQDSDGPTLISMLTEGYTEVRVQVTNYDDGVAFNDNSTLAIYIRQKIFNQKYCNVGMTQQRSLHRHSTWTGNG